MCLILVRTCLALAAGTIAVAAEATCGGQSLTELLSQHATATDCWSIISVNGVKTVFDVTRLVNDHEGGRSVIESMCGNDGSIGFWCAHDREELDEAIEDGHARQMCTVTESVQRRRRDDDDDDDDNSQSRCRGSGTLPPAANRPIDGSFVRGTQTTNECVTVLTQGSSKIVLDVTKYIFFHPGGEAVVKSMCGRDSTASYTNVHSFHYIGGAINEGYIKNLGYLNSEIPLDEPIEPSTVTTEVTEASLRSHTSQTDCWVSCKGLVFDVTVFMNEHPSGNAAFVASCGYDVSGSFTANHPDSYLGRMRKYLQGRLVQSAPILDPTATPTSRPISKGFATYTLVFATSGSVDQASRQTIELEVRSVMTSMGYVQLQPSTTAMSAVDGEVSADISFAFSSPDQLITIERFVADGGLNRVQYMGGLPTRNVEGPVISESQSGEALPGIQAPESAIPSSSPVMLGGSLTLADVGQHSSASDCWLAVGTTIFGFTDGGARHSGGSFDRLGLCGRDATASFQSIHPESYTGRMHEIGATVVGQLSMVAAPLVRATMQPVAASTSLPTQQPMQAVPVVMSTAAPIFSITSMPTAMPASMPTAMPVRSAASSLTLADVGQHSSASDCWLAVGTTIFGFTDGGARHSGGSFDRLGLCGRDATASFQSIHPESYTGRMHEIGATVVGQLSMVAAPLVRATMQPVAPRPTSLPFGRFSSASTLFSSASASPVLHASPPSTSTTPPNSSSSIVVDEPIANTLLSSFTALQLADHNTTSDCWVSVQGHIYAIKNVGLLHSGNSIESHQLCGKDATAALNLQHDNAHISTMQAIGAVLIGTVRAPSAKVRSGSSFLPSITVSLHSGGNDYLERHNTATDCWMALHGKVYEAAGLIQKHEGGRAVVLALCGVDATASFDCNHDREELEEAIEDYGIREIGSTSISAGTGCRFLPPAQLKQIAGEDLPVHNKAASCWAVLDGMVFDLTNYIPKHTGGSGVILTHCGADATAVFRKHHPHGYLTMLLSLGATLLGKLDSPIPEPEIDLFQYRPVSHGELQAHGHPLDCWLGVHGLVVDVSAFRLLHSGGAASLDALCGRDASAAFESVGHTLTHRAMLPIIGCLGDCTPLSARDATETPPPVVTKAQIDPSAATATLSGLLEPRDSPSNVMAKRTCNINEPTPPPTEIGLDELSKHGIPNDCWMSIGCGVYDVSSYIHSGGQALVHAYCGKDATVSFGGKHPWAYLQVLLSQGAVLKGRLGAVPVVSSVSRRAVISPNEVAKHRFANDCWACIAGSVYNLTAFHPTHDAGSAVVLHMCGQKATLSFLMVHTPQALAGIHIEGSCHDQADTAFTEQAILDSSAAVLYIILPIVLSLLTRSCVGVRMQDRLLRRPAAKPMRGSLGQLLNPYLEMPLGPLLLVVLYIISTVGLQWFWLKHYRQYYAAENVKAGSVGRMTIYHLSLASMLGTRRFSWSWALFRISYEKTVKAHQIVGYVACLYILVHGALYFHVFRAALPEHIAPTAWALLLGTAVLLVSSVPSIRVRWYGPFRVIHFLAPLLMWAALLHLAALNTDGALVKGLWGTIAWVGSAALFWLIDFIWSLTNMFSTSTQTTKVEIIHADCHRSRDCPYLFLTMRHSLNVPPGAWLAVSCKQSRSTISHPFTAIVRKDGLQKPEIDFIWKVGDTGWVRNLHDWVDANKSAAEDARFLLSGPHGGGLGSLGTMQTVVFIVGGVGFTPAASMAAHLHAEGKDVVVIWSFRSFNLFTAGRKYFELLPDKNLHFYLTGPADWCDESGTVQRGRPPISKLLQHKRDHCARGSRMDLGVFVCGPTELTRDVLQITESLNSDKAQPYLHVHSESFQM